MTPAIKPTTEKWNPICIRVCRPPALRLFYDAQTRTLGAQNMRKGNRLAMSRVSISDVTRHGGYSFTALTGVGIALCKDLRGEKSCDVSPRDFHHT